MSIRAPAEVAEELVETVDRAAHELRALEDEAASRRPAPGKWSIKEIVGHLIDSAANNHHRFVRAPATELGDGEAFVFADYEQDRWVAAQDYAASPWPELLELWRLYNRHLAWVMTRVPARALGTVCAIGSHPPATLGWLIDDYLVHLEHHLRQIERLR